MKKFLLFMLASILITVLAIVTDQYTKVRDTPEQVVQKMLEADKHDDWGKVYSYFYLPTRLWSEEKYVQMLTNQQTDFQSKLLEYHIVSGKPMQNVKTKQIGFRDPSTDEIKMETKILPKAFVVKAKYEDNIHGVVSVGEIEFPYVLVPDDRGRWQVLWSTIYDFNSLDVENR